jgi:RNA polymerase sigma factor (sigma-70 family)
MPANFEREFDGLFLRAFRLAYRLLSDTAAAEDVAAEACARAFASWTRIGKLPYREAWVLRVASNLAIDAIRRRGRSFSTGDAPQDMEDGVALRLALGVALRELPRRQRETVVLRHVAGLKESEVADALGVSKGSVKTHASRGLASLRARLGATIWEEAPSA